MAAVVEYSANEATMISGHNVTLIEARRDDMPAIIQIASECANWLFCDGGNLSIDRLDSILLATDTGTSSLIWSAWKHREIVGFVTLNNIHPIHRSAEILFLAVRSAQADAWIYSDIAKAISRFAFMHLNLNRIEWKNYAGHRSINALYKRGGAVLEGVKKEARWRNGKFEDLNEWAILRDTWQARHNTTATKRNLYAIRPTG